MVDFENVASIRGPRLADLSQHVIDVLALNLAEEDEYQVGKVALAEYEFVPYALSGLASAMRTPATGVRATTTVTVPLADDVGGTSSVQQVVTLFGPGDVLGVDPSQIVRRYPAPGSTTAEETFHPHIEFDRPELPWAFSAATPSDTMRPWVTLVALERDEAEWEPIQAGLAPVLSVQADRLPDLGEVWAWAHAQTAGGSASLEARLSTAYGSVNVSRLLASRILTQNRNYVACLVPTTEVGRNAGLGLAGGTLGPAWDSSMGTVRLPVYDRWEFRTAPDGDFARLARRLVGVAAPWEIGRRFMEASVPGLPFGDLAPDEPGRRQVIKCALFSPAPPPVGAPDDDAAWSPARIAQLRDALERPARIEGAASTDPGAPPDLPIVGPRLYARGQRGIGTIPAGDWFESLNLTPTHRVVAGLGTRVVIKDQEPLMQAAWAQVGRIDEANRALALAEVSRKLSAALHRRLARVDDGRFVQLLGPLSGRTALDGAPLTIMGEVQRSALPSVALAGAFRRAVRPTGPIARRLDTAESQALVRMVAQRDGSFRDFRRPYVELDGIGGLSTVAIEALDPVVVGKVLGDDPARALTTLKRSNQLVVKQSTLATAVTTPERWGTPDLTFQPARDLAERIGSRLMERLPDVAADDLVLSRSRAGVLAGLAVTKVEHGLDSTAVTLKLDDAIVASPVAVSPVVTTRVGAQPVVRSPRDSLFRSGAARASMPIRAGGGLMGLSEVAVGRVTGSIGRPDLVTTPVGAARPTERQRLDSIRSAQGTLLATWLDTTADLSVEAMRADALTSLGFDGLLQLAPTPPLPVFAAERADMLERLEPNRTVVSSMQARLDLGRLAFDPFVEIIRPIMAAPRFDRPMYQALDAYDREWLVPGLTTMPEPEMVTLLSANDVFTEAFLVGLSDEMGRELLWRQYPTDARGTYFHRFWDAEADELTQPIHRFSRTALGRHVTMAPPGQSGRAVVVIRGEVVRRYPDLTVMAVREQGRTDGLPNLESPTGDIDAARSMFIAMLPPDIMLCGLDITIDQLRTPGWWIVLAEHPQGTRFRRTEADVVGDAVRFARPGSATHGAGVAADRLENRTRIAFEAGDFLPAGP